MSEWICACYNMSITIISTISGPSRMCLKKQSKNNNNKNQNSGGERGWGRAEAEKRRKSRNGKVHLSDVKNRQTNEHAETSDKRTFKRSGSSAALLSLALVYVISPTSRCGTALFPRSSSSGSIFRLLTFKPQHNGQRSLSFLRPSHNGLDSSTSDIFSASSTFRSLAQI